MRRPRRPRDRRTGPRRASVVIALLLTTACADPGRGDGALAPESSGISSPAAAAVIDADRATLRVALLNDPRSLHPRETLDAEGELVVRALFDGLVDVGPDGAVVAAGADRWVVEDEGLTYRFILRPDRFHDGSPVTASAHADALRAVMDPDRRPHAREELLAAVVDVEVLAADELVVRLERADPLFLHRLADPALAPLPRAALLDPAAFGRQPIGNGPFRMLGPREQGAFIRLGAWPEHPTPPRVDELVLQVITEDVDGSRRWEDLLDGRLHIAPIAEEQRDPARARFGSADTRRGGSGLHEAPLLRTYAYGFAVTVPPFDDPVLRRAVSAAIDREGLARSLASAAVLPATSMLPPTVGGAPPVCDHCRQDVELARALIAEWRGGLPEGVAEPTLTITYPRGEGHVTVAERVASDLERVLGVEVRLQAQDLGGLVRLVEEGRAPFFRVGLGATLGGDAAVVSLLGDAFGSGGVSNRYGWEDPTTDLLIADWSAQTSPEVARAVEQQVLDAVVVAPLLWTRPDLVVVPEVRGFRMDVTGRWWPELVRLR